MRNIIYLIALFFPLALFSYTGEVIESFDAPGSYPTGLTFDGENLWLADYKTDMLYCINPDNGEQEVFVHYSAIDGEGYRNLYEGDRVEYDLVDRGKGPQAQNVSAKRSFGSAAQ